MSVILYSVGTSSPILQMEEEVFLEKGTRGLLPCRTDIEVVNLLWSLDPPPARELLVILEYYGGKWIKVVPGNFKGVFDIDQDFSLVIKDVRVESGAAYHCTVGENGTLNAFTNHTVVNVFGKLEYSLKMVHVLYSWCFERM